MAELTEKTEWVDGIYQLETSDPVMGGPGGISNRQANQLANRTAYLKQQQEQTGNALNQHATAANPHPQYAPLASPALTGVPTAPTAVKTDNSTKLATTGYVKTVVADYAPLASPALTGTPTAPTAEQTVNNTQLATTAFVKAAMAALVASSPATLDTLNELAAALGNDPNFATTITNALALKAPLASPAFTGTPTAPTAEQTVNNTQLATTAFVKAATTSVMASGLLEQTGRLTIPLNISGVLRTIYIMWGRTAASEDIGDTAWTVNFPSVFPNAFLSGQVSLRYPSSIDGNAAVYFYNESTSGMSIKLDKYTNVLAGIVAHWLVVGY
ncbi:gp53-like domain-containing protein [Dickeya chrysanthemi]|uniref:gp53-like domain-containing protein n=1 Tax=Dickeya chrysanthemi TaxID=556 RepID=UPI00039C9D49|nr:hypothetical protein [Dickeya chrysanthemi]